MTSLTVTSASSDVYSHTYDSSHLKIAITCVYFPVQSVKNQPSYFADRLYKAMKVKVHCYVIHFPQHLSLSRRNKLKQLM